MQAFVNQHLRLDMPTNATNFQDYLTYKQIPSSLKLHIKKKN